MSCEDIENLDNLEEGSSGCMHEYGKAINAVMMTPRIKERAGMIMCEGGLRLRHVF